MSDDAQDHFEAGYDQAIREVVAYFREMMRVAAIIGKCFQERRFPDGRQRGNTW